MLKSKPLAKSQTCSWYLISGNYCHFYFFGMSNGPCTVQRSEEPGGGYPDNTAGEEGERMPLEGRKNFTTDKIIPVMIC